MAEANRVTIADVLNFLKDRHEQRFSATDVLLQERGDSDLDARQVALVEGLLESLIFLGVMVQVEASSGASGAAAPRTYRRPPGTADVLNRVLRSLLSYAEFGESLFSHLSETGHGNRWHSLSTTLEENRIEFAKRAAGKPWWIRRTLVGQILVVGQAAPGSDPETSRCVLVRTDSDEWMEIKLIGASAETAVDAGSTDVHAARRLAEHGIALRLGKQGPERLQPHPHPLLQVSFVEVSKTAAVLTRYDVVVFPATLSNPRGHLPIPAPEKGGGVSWVNWPDLKKDIDKRDRPADENGLQTGGDGEQPCPYVFPYVFTDPRVQDYIASTDNWVDLDGAVKAPSEAEVVKKAMRPRERYIHRLS